MLAAQGGDFAMISPERWRGRADDFELREVDATHRGMLHGRFPREIAEALARDIARA